LKYSEHILDDSVPPAGLFAAFVQSLSIIIAWPLVGLLAFGSHASATLSITCFIRVRNQLTLLMSRPITAVVATGCNAAAASLSAGLPSGVSTVVGLDAAPNALVLRTPSDFAFAPTSTWLDDFLHKFAASQLTSSNFDASH
jgi:hypothetical protein